MKFKYYTITIIMVLFTEVLFVACNTLSKTTTKEEDFSKNKFYHFGDNRNVLKDSIITDRTILLRNLNLTHFPIKSSDYPSLEKLDISGNCFFPESVSDFKNLKYLIASGIFEETCGATAFGEIDSKPIWQLKKLKKLVLTGTYKRINIPENISVLQELDTLIISNILFYPISLLQLPELKYVSVFSSALSSPEMENLSLIYRSRPLNTSAKISRKIIIPKTGIFTNFYEDGQKLVEGNFIDGKADGKWTFWFPDGKIGQVRYYKYGLEQGEWLILNKESDTLLFQKFNDNGSLDTYYKKGEWEGRPGYYIVEHCSDSINKVSKSDWWNEAKNVRIKTYESKTEYWRKETSYYSNKNKQSEIMYDKDYKLSGKYTRWFENGAIKEEFYYENGLQEGPQRYWNEYGQIYRVEVYSKGKRIK